MENQIVETVMPMFLMNNSLHDVGSVFSKLLNTLLILFFPQIIKWIMTKLPDVSKLVFVLFRKSYSCSFKKHQKCSDGFTSVHQTTKHFEAIRFILTRTLKNDASPPSYTALGSDYDDIILNSTYKIAQDVCVQSTVTQKTFEKTENYTEVYEIKLISYTSMDCIREFIDFAIKEYNDELHKQDPQNIFMLRAYDVKGLPFWGRHNFDCSKTFDNIFFKGKSDLIRRIDAFETGADEYKRLGIPYTMGLMFHGEPGTGKTSAIKSIANYTKRHLVVIPMKKIKTIDQLRTIMDKYIGSYSIPNKERLYVFEEIDCGAWSDVVKSRLHNDSIHEKEHKEKDKKKTDGLVLVDKILSKMNGNQDKDADGYIDDDQDAPTLGEFLELLDGVLEMPGRMIIFTSNHPEHLDPALLRPGRIDVNIHFGRMRKKDVADMYKLWFDACIPNDIYDKMVDLVFTQAEIANIFACRNLEEIHNKIIGSPM